MRKSSDLMNESDRKFEQSAGICLNREFKEFISSFDQQYLCKNEKSSQLWSNILWLTKSREAAGYWQEFWVDKNFGLAAEFCIYTELN